MLHAMRHAALSAAAERIGRSTARATAVRAFQPAGISCRVHIPASQCVMQLQQPQQLPQAFHCSSTSSPSRRTGRRVNASQPLRPSPTLAATVAAASTAAAPAALAGNGRADAGAAAGATAASDASSATVRDVAVGVASSATGADDCSWLVQQGSDVLLALHSTLGTPWWCTILLIGVGSRVLLSPLQLHSARLMASLSGLEPHFVQIDALARESAGTPWQRNVAALRLKWMLMRTHQCSPLRLLPSTGAQIGVFVLLAMSVRRLVRSEPDLASGGALWFPDLAAADGTMALPIAVWAAGYALSHVTATYYERKAADRQQQLRRTLGEQKEEHTQQQHTPQQQPPTVTARPVPAADFSRVDAAVAHVRGALGQLGHLLRGVQVLSILVLPSFPCGVLLLWSAGIGWQALWHALIRRDDVRERLGLTQRERSVIHRAEQRAGQRTHARTQLQPQPQLQPASSGRRQQQLKQTRHTRHAPQASPAATGAAAAKQAGPPRAARVATDAPAQPAGAAPKSKQARR